MKTMVAHERAGTSAESQQGIDSAATNRTQSRMKVLLVGNYEFDGATSMKVWAGALLRELRQRGIDVRLVSPRPVFGRLRRSSGGLGKWLGYIDRFMIFPRDLRAAAGSADVVHICDHGSAVYTAALKNKATIVTCHDMLAVRGAMGEAVDCPASFFGRLLQRRIRRGMRRATRVACVSEYTLNDARRILDGAGNLRMVLNGLNYPFSPLDSSEVDRRLAALPGGREPFILHVGSNLARKNREGVLRIFAMASQRTGLRMIFAGAGLSRELAEQARELRVADRIVQVEKPEVETLEALYNRATALLFPSRYEGFGWPPIEAQACGCPVVASNIPPLAEVLGQSAELRPVEDESGMADALRRLLTDRAFHDEMRRRGFENVASRFQTSRMMRDYLSLYRELACQG
jgi:glycosyltransferase involved in cell wall biosynthesis